MLAVNPIVLRRVDWRGPPHSITNRQLPGLENLELCCMKSVLGPALDEVSCCLLIMTHVFMHDQDIIALGGRRICSKNAAIARSNITDGTDSSVSVAERNL